MKCRGDARAPVGRQCGYVGHARDLQDLPTAADTAAVAATNAAAAVVVDLVGLP